MPHAIGQHFSWDSENFPETNKTTHSRVEPLAFHLVHLHWMMNSTIVNSLQVNGCSTSTWTQLKDSSKWCWPLSWRQWMINCDVWQNKVVSMNELIVEIREGVSWMGWLVEWVGSQQNEMARSNVEVILNDGEAISGETHLIEIFRVENAFDCPSTQIDVSRASIKLHCLYLQNETVQMSSTIYRLWVKSIFVAKSDGSFYDDSTVALTGIEKWTNDLPWIPNETAGIGQISFTGGYIPTTTTTTYPILYTSRFASVSKRFEMQYFSAFASQVSCKNDIQPTFILIFLHSGVHHRGLWCDSRVDCETMYASVCVCMWNGLAANRPP